MLVIHFSDPDNKEIVVESGGTRALVNVVFRTVDGKPAIAPNAPAPPATTSAAPPSAPRRAELPVDQYAHEGAFFGSNIVNLPDGKPLKAGEVDFLNRTSLRADIRAAGWGGLFGFDSGATITFGDVWA